MIGSFSQPFSNDAIAGAAVNVKVGPGLIFLLNLIETTGVDSYLQVFDTLAVSVVLGTTIPKFFLRVPGGSSLLISLPGSPVDLMKGTGMSIAATTGPGNAAAGGLSVVAFFQ